MVQKEVLKNELKNESLAEAAEETNATVKILEDLFDTSGCKNQICDNCDFFAGLNPKDFKESNWYCMQARKKIE